MIHPDTLEEIKRRLDIVEVIGDFLPLKKAGQNYRAKSPLTNERTPSFFVVPSKALFKDFSSGKGGDTLAFLMEYEGMDYVGAVKYLADKYGVEMKATGGAEHAAARSERESITATLRFAGEYYRHALSDTDEGRRVGGEYFQRRGFTPEIIQQFELGYAPDGVDALLRAALEKGYSEESLERAGLIMVNPERKPYDRFRKRVMFPIHNLMGTLIGFGARLLEQGRNQPKYLNSPETDLYQKSRTLYGLHLAKSAMRREDNCYLVEGYTDVISLRQAGVENVVSSSGTALTVEQIALIRRFTRRVTMLFDGDPAGVNAALRGVDLALEEDLDVSVVLLPDNHDPDSYLKSMGSERFLALLDERRRDFISFKTDLLLAGAAADPARKADAVGQILDSIVRIPNAVKQSLYVRQVAVQLRIDEAALAIEFEKKNHRLRQRSRRVEQVAPTAEQPLPAPNLNAPEAMVHLQEQETIRLLLHYADWELDEQRLLHFIGNELEDVTFTHPVCREIYAAFMHTRQTQQPIDSRRLLESCSAEARQVAAELLTPRYQASPHWRERYQIYFPQEEELLNKLAYTNVIRLKLRIIQRMASDNCRELGEARDADQIDALMERQVQLDEMKRTLSERLGIVIA